MAWQLQFGMVKCPCCQLGAFPIGVRLQAQVRIHPGGRYASPTREDSQSHWIRGCETQLEVIVQRRLAAVS